MGVQSKASVRPCSIEVIVDPESMIRSSFRQGAAAFDTAVNEAWNRFCADAQQFQATMRQFRGQLDQARADVHHQRAALRGQEAAVQGIQEGVKRVQQQEATLSDRIDALQQGADEVRALADSALSCAQGVRAEQRTNNAQLNELKRLLQDNDTEITYLQDVYKRERWSAYHIVALAVACVAVTIFAVFRTL